MTDHFVTVQIVVSSPSNVTSKRIQEEVNVLCHNLEKLDVKEGKESNHVFLRSCEVKRVD